jgi:hypothetical protein
MSDVMSVLARSMALLAEDFIEWAGDSPDAADRADDDMDEDESVYDTRRGLPCPAQSSGQEHKLEIRLAHISRGP